MNTQPAGMAVDTNNNNLYITSSTSVYVWKCSINTYDGTIAGCNHALYIPGGGAIRISLSSNAGNRYANIIISSLGADGLRRTNVQICEIANDNTFINCRIRASENHAQVTDSVASPFSSYLYAVNTAGIPEVCQADFSGCTPAVDLINLRQPDEPMIPPVTTSIATPPTGQYIYIGDFTRHKVYACAINYYNSGRLQCGAYRDASFSNILSMSYR